MRKKIIFRGELALILRQFQADCMLIFREQAPLTAYLSAIRSRGARIGFVPTMGALHAGHLSLVEAAGRHADTVVVSIFVNPTQFNDPEDFKKYPVRTDQDIRMLSGSAADVLYLPDAAQVYGKDGPGPARYDFGHLETVLEGAHRPGHFQGVGQVMERLLTQVPADYLAMGRKDYQQILIVNKLIALLHLKTEMIPCPIVREPDGLAMSSRNLRLGPEARSLAPELYRTLRETAAGFYELPFGELRARAVDRLEKAGFRVEYLELTTEDLEPVTAPRQGTRVLLAAAWLDGIRLIDNLVTKPATLESTRRVEVSRP
jgi:pantoate--beta-alanine ligase